MTRFSRKAIRDEVYSKLEEFCSENNVEWHKTPAQAKYQYSDNQYQNWLLAQGMYKALRMIDCFGYQED
jgi:hypothetical protein